MPDWSDANCTWAEFEERGLAKAGTLIEVDDFDGVPRAGVPRYLMIGDINELGGVCDCCKITYRSCVLRYAVIWRNPADAPSAGG